VFRNCALGFVTRRQRKQSDKQDRAVIQTSAGRRAIKCDAEQSFNIDGPKSDRNEEPIIQFLKRIEIGMIRLAKPMKFSDQIVAVFQPVIR